MKKLQRSIEYCMLLLVLIGSLLLSISIGNFRLFFIALACAVTGFIITDTLKLFRIHGWLANVASIGSLVLAMQDFFGADSSGKLIAVAALLVYMQSILMFQEKTPRLNWQILVLSLLEVVITAIFSVGFENSYLLILYFMIAGTALVLQCIFVDEIDIHRRNRAIADRFNAGPNAAPNQLTHAPEAAGLSVSMPKQSGALLMFDAPRWQKRSLWPVLLQLSVWTIASLAITAAAFMIAPRTSQPFFKSISYQVTATGFTTKVDLNEKGKISQSNRVVFRSEFRSPETLEPVQLTTPPYFRSMALGSLQIEDGHTTWKAPFDRLISSHYHSLGRQYYEGKRLRLTTTLEPNTSPQIYSPMPALLSNHTPNELKFCQEISALTRCQFGGKVTAAAFKYEMATVVDQQNRPLKGWPYLSGTRFSRDQTMAAHPMRVKWLTEIDRSRYPTLVAMADLIAAEVKAEGGGRLEVIERMTDWFSSNGFKYTLDYTDVVRNESLDTVEDFFRNHRAGHCEMYASALTLMLRCQNIPARLVVGFLATDYNNITNSYVVRAKHAHAWVEAYLPPNQCTPEMKRIGTAGPGGCWLTADPNPAETLNSNYDSANDPIELARTVWQDIVLGSESSTHQPNLEDASQLYQMFAATKANTQITLKAIAGLPRQPRFLIVVGLTLLFGFLLRMRKSMSRQSSGKATKGQRASLLRRMVASAAGLLSPDLESWFLASVANDGTEFYDKMERLLQQHNLVRPATQTHRQFAFTAAESFKQHPATEEITDWIYALTEKFNEIRFGQQQLSDQQKTLLDQTLKQLETALAEEPNAL